jgi:hypothetical protein
MWDLTLIWKQFWQSGQALYPFYDWILTFKSDPLVTIVFE